MLLFITRFVGLDDRILIDASLRASKPVGTPEAVEPFERIAGFWEPELDAMQKRLLDRPRRP